MAAHLLRGVRELGCGHERSQCDQTSQLAFPQGISEAVYADDRYPVSTEDLDDISLESDMVLAEDGAALQMAIMSGGNEAGYTAVLAVGV